MRLMTRPRRNDPPPTRCRDGHDTPRLGGAGVPTGCARDRLPPAYRPLTVRAKPVRAMPVQSAVMSTDDRSASRAEARRRARLAARGELPEEEEPEPAAEAPRRARLVPGPHVSAGAAAAGPRRSARRLRRQRPAAADHASGSTCFAATSSPGCCPASARSSATSPRSATVARTCSAWWGRSSCSASLIAAGWFGSQRPTLFGTAAGFVGFVVASALVLLSFAERGAGIDTFGVGAIGQLFVQGLYLSGLGFIGGWYGGYLRRRQTQLSADQRRRQRRR